MDQQVIFQAQEIFREKVNTLTGDELYEYSTRADIKKLITDIYFRLLAKKPKGCNNCWADAMIEIINISKKIIMDKLSCDYAVRAGYLARDRFGDAAKNMTQHNITNELAEYHLATNPGIDKYFTRLPDDWQDRVAVKLREPEIAKLMGLTIDKTVVKVKPVNAGKIDEEKEKQIIDDPPDPKPNPVIPEPEKEDEQEDPPEKDEENEPDPPKNKGLAMKAPVHKPPTKKAGRPKKKR
jgi:hypothetical protein